MRNRFPEKPLALRDARRLVARGARVVVHPGGSVSVRRRWPDMMRIEVELPEEVPDAVRRDDQSAEVARVLDRAIARYGPDAPRSEARLKGTDRVEDESRPSTDTAHGGDGASGEVSDPEPREAPGEGGDETNEQSTPSDDPSGGDSGGSGATAGDPGAGDASGGGSTGGAPDDARSSSDGAEPRGSGASPARPADRGGEGPGARADRGGSATPTASGRPAGDTPSESSAAPSSVGVAGERGHPTGDENCNGEGASPVAASPDTSGTGSVLRSGHDRGTERGSDFPPTGGSIEASRFRSDEERNLKSATPDRSDRGWRSSVDRLREALEAEAERRTGADRQRERKWLRASARHLQRDDKRELALRLVARAAGEIPAPGRSAWLPPEIGQLAKEAMLAGSTSLVGGSGRTGGSWVHLDADEVRLHLETLRQDRVARRLRRALERFLDRELGAYGDPTPRLDARRLVTELAGRSVRLSRCRREEHEQSTAILAVDVSGSCAVHSAQTMAAAILLAREDDRLVVIEHQNGAPTRAITTRGQRVLDEDAYYPSNAFSSRSIAAAAMHESDLDRSCVGTWLALLREHQTRALIWLGDGDGCLVRRDICVLARPAIRLLMLDAYTASLGEARQAPAKMREPWADEHYVGVSSASTVLSAMKRTETQ